MDFVLCISVWNHTICSLHFALSDSVLYLLVEAEGNKALCVLK